LAQAGTIYTPKHRSNLAMQIKYLKSTALARISHVI